MALTPRRVRSFDFTLACRGAPDAISVHSRAEVIGLDEVLKRFGDLPARPLPVPFAYDERFIFTHVLGDEHHGFLLGDESTT
ncbi:MAG: hypothetical protein SFW67_04090 [Myxococcaceae bacterium]|nr:hypothetical protein [Myxococcaceae bacterium]